jgi:hypothetical protein
MTDALIHCDKLQLFERLFWIAAQYSNVSDRDTFQEIKIFGFVANAI